tara:strand:- start:8114 stop:9958 length:1845 start_codon:yes stop_codon:yes gene_type:complete
MFLPLLASLVLQDAPDLVSPEFHVAEGLQVRVVESDLPSRVLAVPGPTVGVQLLPIDAPGPVLFLRVQGDGHEQTTLADSTFGVQSAVATPDALWVLRGGSLVQIRRDDPNGWKSEARIDAAPAGTRRLELGPGHRLLAITHADLRIRGVAGVWSTISSGLDQDAHVCVMNDGTRLVIESLPDGDRLATLPPGGVQPVPVTDGDLRIPDVEPERSRIGSLVASAPVGWPLDWHQDVLIVRPSLGRIEGIQLLQRGADLALGGVRTVFQSDPARFTPRQLVVDAGGQDLWVLGQRADGSSQLLRVTPTDPRDIDGPAASLDTLDPSARFRILHALVASKLDGLAEIERQLLGPGEIQDRSLPRHLQVPVYAGLLRTVAGRVATVHTLPAFWDVGPQPRLRAKILLERCLFHQAPDVRVAACEVLGRWPDTLNDPDRFGALLGDPDGRVAAAAADAAACRDYRLLGPQLFAQFRLVLESGGHRTANLFASQVSALRRLRAWRPIVNDLCREPLADTRRSLWSLLDDVYDEDLVLLLKGRLLDGATPFQVRLEIVNVLADQHLRPNADGQSETWEQSEVIERWLTAASKLDESPAVRERATQVLTAMRDESSTSDDE